MHAKIYSATTIGIDAQGVEVEVDLSLGLVSFCIVGLADKAIKESKERIKAALKNTGLRLPQRAITVNLAPANIKKEGVLFDLPIAIAILQAAGLITCSPSFIEETLFLGELSLDGSIRAVKGILSIAHSVHEAGKRRLVIPSANVLEASLVSDIEVIGVRSLHELIAYLRGEKSIPPVPLSGEPQNTTPSYTIDFSEVRGQWQAKRALQIAAAGRHNILFIGPPGSGKTMLAQRLLTILPPMSVHEMLETTKIYSVAGLLKDEKLLSQRPFRAPHHTISAAGLVGGGSTPQPGEISLAHNGVLFLDELTEFKRSTLEVLRQPLESKKVLISRANMAVEFPSSFLLVAALNPCPCGFWGDQKRTCVCSREDVRRYMGKISGPLLDRIDLHVTVSSLNFDELVCSTEGQEGSSPELYKNIETATKQVAARKQQCSNALLCAHDIDTYCTITAEATAVIRKAFEVLNLSMRSYHKIIKIARTIADLEGSPSIESLHIREALIYRSLDQKIS